MILSCLFSCFHHVKQSITCFYLTYLNFFLLQWYGQVFSQMKSKSAIFMIKRNFKLMMWILLLQYNSFLISLISLLNTCPAVTDLLKVNNKHNRVSCTISTKLRIKTPEQRFCSSLFWGGDKWGSLFNIQFRRIWQQLWWRKEHLHAV